MTIRDIRKKRLRQLVDEFGTQQALADRLGFEQNYISKLLKPGSPFGEKAARKIERAARKQDGWLDVESGRDGPRDVEWPFGFDRELWFRLSPTQQDEIEAALLRQILGSGVEQALTRPVSKRRKT